MLRISNHYISKVVSSLLVMEMFILIGAFYVGAGLRFFDGGAFALPKLDHFFLSACTFAAAILFSMSALGMYHINFSARLGKPFLMQLMPSFAMGFGILTLVFYVAPDLYFGRGMLMLVFLIAASGIALVRTAFLKTSESAYLKSRIIFLGSGALARDNGNLALRLGSYRKYHIVGYVPAPQEESCVPAHSLLPLGAGTSLLALANQHGVTEVVVSLQNRRCGAFSTEELLACKLNGIRITDADSFFERETCQIHVESMQPSWLVYGAGFDQSFQRMFMKRGFDIIVSLAIMVLSLPVMLATALCIYVEDGAPVLYHQERVGKGGRLFKVIKFRSMRRDAESNGTPLWAARNDSRVTRVGHFIRRMRIDELPQIWNVFQGEMSFVGPRPERAHFAQQLIDGVPYYNVRHCLKPGITGWAQVRYGYGDSIEDAVHKLRYDLYYVKNNSLLLDVLILIDTVKVVLFGSGR